MGNHHSHSTNSQSILFGLIINSCFAAIEFIFGLLTGSLALIADATHNITDSTTLTVSFIADKVALKKANHSMTYGYGRITIVAALINSIVMIGVSAFIVHGAYLRLDDVHEVDGTTVIVISSIGIVVNATIAYLLSRSRQDLNIRSAFIDMLFDTFSSLGALVAGLIIALTGIVGIDTVVGVTIGVLLSYNAFKILREALHILLEGTPQGVSIEKIAGTIRSIDKVLDVRDIHVWAIRSGYNSLSCHVIIKHSDFVHSHEIVKDVKTLLKSTHDIHHATIEVVRDDDLHDETIEVH